MQFCWRPCLFPHTTNTQPQKLKDFIDIFSSKSFIELNRLALWNLSLSLIRNEIRIIDILGLMSILSSPSKQCHGLLSMAKSSMLWSSTTPPPPSSWLHCWLLLCVKQFILLWMLWIWRICLSSMRELVFYYNRLWRIH